MTFPVADALAWCDQWFDRDASLLWNPAGSYDELAPPRSLHLVPQSAWYGAGVLAARGDAARAAAVFDRLCGLQYDAPGTPWHGTFARFAETPVPSVGAVEWVDYDPNWRQFLGTVFSLVLARFAGELPGATVASMRDAVSSAVRGEPPDRVPPTYSNIALMRAWLEGEEAYGRAVVAAFDEHGAFDEYNSPTYYGIDLFALGLWARHSPPTSFFAVEGARVEAALWRDVARWWHAGLGNLCGPWSRSYGMDMASYAALLGLFIGPRAFPDLSGPFDHSHDVTFAPMVDFVRAGDGIPDDVRSVLSSFPGEHTVEQRLGGDRIATGWLADDVMFGGEAGGPFPARGQYHPATAHWSGGGWLRVRHSSPVDAVASAGRLVVEARGHGDATVLMSPGAAGTLGAPGTASCRVAVEVDGSVVDGDALASGKARFPGAWRIVVFASDQS